MSTTLSRAEGFAAVYKAFDDISFKSFDYNAVKQSLIDYIKLYFPETFNDFIESSELIAIIETFAYVAELCNYRMDVGAHENLLPVAQRKQNVLRLAKYISYKPSRNTPARGLVKITGISTSESVTDSRGLDLRARKIVWNDSGNVFWKEQFLTVLNRTLSQPYGSVGYGDRIQVQDILFEKYTLRNNQLNNGVLSFSAAQNGEVYPMEAVPVTLTKNGPVERRPSRTSSFGMLSLTDGLGDWSPSTGFFVYVKQGSLSRQTLAFDGKIPNRRVDLPTSNVNDTDVWVNQVSPSTGTTVNDGSILNGVSGEWEAVANTNSENISFNTITARNKYEIETLENDAIRLIFGDGEFASVPVGTFDVWVRTSANRELTFTQSNITDVPLSIPYTDNIGVERVLTLYVTMTTPMQSGNATETMDHIRRVAPSVYYTQDRMVNAKDYNTYLLQDPSIFKLKAINRTFAGGSKYRAYTDFGGDPSGTYDNIKMYGTDLAVYYETTETTANVVERLNAEALVVNYVQPMLSDEGSIIHRAVMQQANLPQRSFRSALVSVDDPVLAGAFVADINDPDSNKLELQSIVYSLGDDVTYNGQTFVNASPTFPVVIWYDTTVNRWRTDKTDPFDPFPKVVVNPMFIVDRPSVGSYAWTVRTVTMSLVAESNALKFWHANTDRVLNFETLNTRKDAVTVLSTNLGAARDRYIGEDIPLYVYGQPTVQSGYPDAGLRDVHKLCVLPSDDNFDGIPDDIHLPAVVNYTQDVEEAGLYDAPFTYPKGRGDVIVYGLDLAGAITGVLTKDTHWFEGPTTSDVSRTSSEVTVLSLAGYAAARIAIREYVYFTRTLTTDPWIQIATTPQTVIEFETKTVSNTGSLHRRVHGRSGLMFYWTHYTNNYDLIDPAATNIIDAFVITRGFYQQHLDWIQGLTNDRPAPPTAFELNVAYEKLLRNKMISDTVVVRPGKFKLLFGPKANTELQCTFKVIRSVYSTLTDNEIKLNIVSAVRDFFAPKNIDFGQTFYFTELVTAIHNALPTEIDTVVLVPVNQLVETDNDNLLVQINSDEDELFMPDITVADINLVSTLVRTNVIQVGV